MNYEKIAVEIQVKGTYWVRPWRSSRLRKRAGDGQWEEQNTREHSEGPLMEQLHQPPSILTILLLYLRVIGNSKPTFTWVFNFHKSLNAPLRLLQFYYEWLTELGHLQRYQVQGTKRSNLITTSLFIHPEKKPAKSHGIPTYPHYSRRNIVGNMGIVI